MSYTKLFGSIIGSTIWRQSLHVKVVWITMLAMKDQDGIVEVSLPGLAHLAGVTLEQATEAIRDLMAPDPHSSTKDREGRRIEEVDGGWRVLNHFKYRDKEDQDERRRKDAERQQRKRGRGRHALSRTVTDSHGVSRVVTPSDTDTDPEQDSISVPDRALSPFKLPDPDRGPLRDLVQAPPPVDRSAARDSGRRIPAAPALPAASAGPDAPLPPAAPRTAARLVALFVELVNAARARVAEHHRVQLRPIYEQGVGAPELLARIRGAPDPEAEVRHAIAAAEAQAIRDPDAARWLSWSIAEPKAWRAHLAAAPARTRSKAGRSEPVRRSGAEASAEAAELGVDMKSYGEEDD
jgi:hypothetical protein